MGSTSVNGFPWPPETGVLPDVPYWLQQLAEAIEAKMPRGEIGYQARTQQAGPVTAAAGYVAVAGLSASVTLATARRLWLTFSGQSTSQTAGTTVGVRIRNVTTGGAKTTTVTIPVNNYGVQHFNSVRTTLAAGTYTFDVSLAQFGGAGDAFLTADPAELLILDLGPA